MKLRSILLPAAGLLLLALAVAVVFLPRPAARPDLPELPTIEAGDRIALFLTASETLPPPESLGIVQRARAAGAELRVLAPGESMGSFAPTRVLEAAAGPNRPTGYHPDLWPTLPAEEARSGRAWHLLVLTPEEQAVKNAAILEAAHDLRDSGTDDARGSREAALLSSARRAELIFPLIP